jgi:hypothetical protein
MNTDMDIVGGERFDWKVLLFVTILVLIFGSVSLIYPFGRNQGIHAFTAYSCLQGGVLYRDVFNVKPPLTAPTHVLALLLFGHSMISIRILDLFWNILTALSLSFLAWKIFRRSWVAVMAGGLYAYSYYSFSYWHTAQTEGWLSLPCVIAMIVIMSPRAFRCECGPNIQISRWFGAGFCVAIAVLYKYTIGLLLPGFALVGLCFCPGRRSKFAAVVWVIAGFLVPIALAALWLLARGALPGFIDCQVKIMVLYSSVKNVHGPFQPFFYFLKRLFQDFPVVSVLGFTGLVACIYSFVRSAESHRMEARVAVSLTLLWFLSACASVIVQGKFFQVHFLPVVPPLVILSCWAATCILAPFSMKGRWLSLLALILVFACLAAAPPYPGKFRALFRVISGRTSLRRYWMMPQFTGKSFSLKDDLMLVDYLRDVSEPGDRVNIWGFEPSVNFLARRRIVSRFPFSHPLVPVSGLQEFREEFIGEFRADPPEYLVVQRGDNYPPSMGHRKDSYATFMEFDELRDLVGERYELIREIGKVAGEGAPDGSSRFLVYRLRM